MSWLILIAIVKLYIATENILLCASVWGLTRLAMGLIYGVAFPALLISVAISFAFAYAYFYILSLIDGGVLWYLAAFGLPIATALASAYWFSG